MMTERMTHISIDDLDGLLARLRAAEARVAALQAEVERQMDVARRLDAGLMDQSANRQRIVELELAGRAVVDGVIRPPRKNGGVGQCAGCWSAWGRGSTETQAWHYADCPVGAFAALLTEATPSTTAGAGEGA
jgi:hypothetical protein